MPALQTWLFLFQSLIITCLWEKKRKVLSNKMFHNLFAWTWIFFFFFFTVMIWKGSFLIHFFPLTLFPSVSVICESVGSACPQWACWGPASLRLRASTFRHAALWAMINLWEPSRWLSSSSAELWASGSSGTAGLQVAGSSTLSLPKGLHSTGPLLGPLTWNIFRLTVERCC